MQRNNHALKRELLLKRKNGIESYAQHFFIDIQVKYQIYVVGPLNSPLWGCKCWNITEKSVIN